MTGVSFLAVMKKDKLNYASSGVDIAAADKAVEKIKNLARDTFNESVLSEIGSFGGFFKPDLSEYNNPVIISSADGVGTKLKIAFKMNKHNTVGEDLVNHCVNDILVHGAEPLFFMDYIATGKLKPETIAEIVSGFSRGCKNNGMALLGGETAEMPDFYGEGEYDLAGFIVGLVDQEKVINGQSIKEGDILIGLASNGLHTNGYSLARKVAFEIAGLQPDEHIQSLGVSIGEALLKIHKSYLRAVRALMKEHPIAGMAHITGGGISGNLSRILPEGLRAVINKPSWLIPPIFDFLRSKGDIDENDMFEAFNMGIGFIIVLDAKDAPEAMHTLKAEGETPFRIGKIEKGDTAVILK